jgi:polar amino acid transport system ATP-binding protein
MPILSAHDLYKSFDGTEILKGISVDVEQGEVLTIIGPSGSGKKHPSAVHHPAGNHRPG